MPGELVFRSTLCELHRADCLAWLSEQPERSIDAVVTDPPFVLVEYSPEELTKRRANRGVWRVPPAFDGWTRRPLPRFTELTRPQLTTLITFYSDLGEALARILKPGAHVLVASTPLVSHRVAAAFTSAGLERRGELVRLTSTFRGGDRPKGAELEFSTVSVLPRSGWEPWLLFRRPLEGTVAENLRKWGTGALRRPAAQRPFGDVFRSGRPTPAERLVSKHPSLKPQAFLRQIVHAVLPFGEGVVLDPFAGSGSTLAAASWHGYRSIGVEIDPAFAADAAQAIPRLAALESKASAAEDEGGRAQAMLAAS